MTREEFESILEEAFLEGYNDAMSEIFDEDSSFDLEDEMDSYTESKNVKRQMEKFLINKGAKSRVHSYYDIPKKYLDRMQTNRQDPSYDWNDRGGKVDWNIANEKPAYMSRGVNWDKIKNRANKDRKYKYAPLRGRFQVE